MFPITLPNFDPTIISFGFIAIRWYSLAYIFGIIATWLFLKKAHKNGVLSAEALDSWLLWAVLGIILGGRLGYVLFYNISFYAEYPLQALAIWQGGMSFHGGLIGAIISMWFFCRRYQIEFLRLTDILSIAAPIGLFFGRISNFINMELYGRPTGSNFGVIFPNVDNLPRHPSQLYEAFLEGLLIFIILFSLNKFTKIGNQKGVISGLFLIFYGLARLFVEQFRQPDEQIGFLIGQITMGQFLSFPIIILGILVVKSAIKSAE